MKFRSDRDDGQRQNVILSLSDAHNNIVINHVSPRNVSTSAKTEDWIRRRWEYYLSVDIKFTLYIQNIRDDRLILSYHYCQI